MKKLVLSIAALFGCYTANCQIQVSLEEAINQALKNKPSIAKTNLEVDIAREQWNESKRKYAPDIRGEFTLQYNPIIATSIIPIGQLNPGAATEETRAVQFGQPWSNSAGIRGKQVLYSPGLRSELKEKRLEVERAVWNTAAEAEAIRYEVTQAYYNVLLASEELKFAVADTIRANEVYQLAVQRLAQQQIKEVEKNQAGYDLLNTRFQYQKLEAARENARLKLLYTMCLPTNTAITLTNELSALAVTNAASVDSLMVAQRSDYQKSVNETKLYQQQLQSERAKLLPELSLNAFVGTNQFTQTFNLTESNSWFGNSFVNLNASIPLSAFYQQNKRIQQAKSRVEKSQLSLKEIKQSFEYETKLATNQLKTAVNDYLNQQEGLKLSRQLYEDRLYRYKEGQALSSEVKTAFADVQQAEYRTLKALYDIVIHQLELDRLTGFIINKN